mmetsp:Transcript_9669/g.22208  ORF Transcript_9669/g.22208 Transcript_9669/m.22208 type:complete len:118 (+) Transcript_9669:74-427(+)
MSAVDGGYPRLNASMLQTGQWGDAIISVVGKTVGFDGSSVSFECADGGKIQVGNIPPEFEFTPGKAVEIVGAAQADGTVQYFIERELTEGFDFDNYNQLISKVMNQPKYQDLFGYTA